MAFRTGAYVTALADRLNRDSESLESWTYVLPGIGEAAATSTLSKFHKENVSGHKLHYLYFNNI